MRIIVTGSPGVGKTSVAEQLGKALHHKVLNEKDFAVQRGIGKWDAQEDELVIPLERFAKELKALLTRKKSIIIEGHMLCELKLNADIIVLVRVHPEILEPRLRARGYSEPKVQENVFCEAVDYCKKYVLRNYPKEKIIEIDTGRKTIKETTDNIISEISKRGVNNERKNYT